MLNLIGEIPPAARRLDVADATLHASVVIDEPTFDQAGDATDGFTPHGAISVKGRAEEVAVFALPLDPAA